MSSTNFLGNGEAFQEQSLAAHNELRKKHGCPPLKWSKDLAENAQTWAEKLADRGTLLYAEIPGVGENITRLTSDDTCSKRIENNCIVEKNHQEIDGQYSVKIWAREHEKYDFGKSGWQRKALNFTQMIWKSSVELGIAKATTKDKKSTFVVAFYKPAGNSNKSGDFEKNVQKSVE